MQMHRTLNLPQHPWPLMLECATPQGQPRHSFHEPWRMEHEMTRQRVALPVADASAFARSLRAQLAAQAQLPGHVEMLNLLAQAAGFRNFQALRAAPPAAPAAPAPTATAELSDTARKALGQFDDQGRLTRLPVKLSVQRMAMWALWLHVPARRSLSEREVNEVLKQWNTFGDHVTPRRELINMQLMTRQPDCSDYRKVLVRPSAEVAAFLKAYRARLPRTRNARGG